ncbi:MAG TPA: pseudouridine synthase [Mycobacteriales bacterium]|nr:pseudouridine synthase [Mycobacteriales bacterium]
MSQPQPETAPTGERLHKVLAAAGVASRRACEEMIAAGRVTVNGEVVSRPGRRIDPARDLVHVDSERVALHPDLVYLALNKPPGVLSTMSDDRGRPTVGDWVADRPQRLFHVGRLDADSEGLLILTNDGQLAHRLTHPSHGVPKTYLARVRGPVRRDLGRRLRAGVVLEDGPVRVDGFRLVESAGQQAMVEVVLHEGRRHVVRRLLAETGHPVSRLVRTSIGPVRLGHQKPGTLRRLGREEIGKLYRSVGL